MIATLSETHKVQCGWIQDINWSGLETCRFDDSLAVFCIRISDFSAVLEGLKKHLHESEIERSLRYHHEKDTHRFIVSRGILRILLGKYLDMHPSGIEFYLEDKLKPRVRHSGEALHFNVSHSGDLVLIAISRSPVGVDLEYLDEGYAYQQILDKAFNPEELAFIQNSVDPMQAFYLLWTRKEALLKATGKGIDDDLRGIPSLDGLHHISAGLSGSTEPWSVHSLVLEDQYIGSVAYSGTVKQHELCLYRIGPTNLSF